MEIILEMLANKTKDDINLFGRCGLIEHVVNMEQLVIMNFFN